MKFALNTTNLKRENEIGAAFVVAQDEEGNYEPVALVGFVSEAEEIIADDLKRRFQKLDRDEDPGLCPYEYILWARGINGGYEIIGTALVTEPTAPAKPRTAAVEKVTKQ